MTVLGLVEWFCWNIFQKAYYDIRIMPLVVYAVFVRSAQQPLNRYKLKSFYYGFFASILTIRHGCIDLLKGFCLKLYCIIFLPFLLFSSSVGLPVLYKKSILCI